MAETERIINDLNVVKITLCNSQMLLTPEMRVRIGQVITSAIDLLKEQEPVEPNKPGTAYKTTWFCGVCSYPISTAWAACPSCGRAVKWKEMSENA